MILGSESEREKHESKSVMNRTHVRFCLLSLLLLFWVGFEIFLEFIVCWVGCGVYGPTTFLPSLWEGVIIITCWFGKCV